LKYREFPRFILNNDIEESEDDDVVIITVSEAQSILEDSIYIKEVSSSFKYYDIEFDDLLFNIEVTFGLDPVSGYL